MAGSDANLNILVARPDRVGDVVLSTPVFEVLKRHYPRARLSVLVRDPIVPLIRGLPGVDDVMTYDPDGRHAGVNGLFRLIAEIKEKRFRIGVVLQSDRKIAAALFASGVRYRVGPLSKPHSFLFYNRGVRQRRSLVEMHETDYNLQLLRRLGVRAGTRSVPTRIALTDQARETGRSWLALRGWQPGASELVVVHPGMGGSALNWPEAHYLELIRALTLEGRQVLVTGGPTEAALLERLRAGLGDDAAKVMFYGGREVGPLDQFAGLLSWASVVVAPSTGPLHMAVALGKPVVTFYPPIRVQSALRWGPYRPDENRSSILVPEVYCGQDFKCRGSVCNYFPCMKTLTVEQTLEQVREQLRRGSEERRSNG